MKLEFLRNEAGEDEGLGNAGIETYRDDPYASVAREIGQNSRDAGSGNGQPVRISFDLLKIPLRGIPGVDQLREVTGLCLKKAKASRDQKEEEFFAQAQSRLSDDYLTVLRIADYNTTGLRGPAVSGSPFNSLVKGSGVSRKKDEWSGGSFGIGKNAVFAITDLQTVLYSTVYEDDEGVRKFLCQGKSILVSHRDAAGVDRRQQGYWGAPGFSAICSQREVPDWLRREEVGTSVFAIGFRESTDWQWRIVFSLIQNFYQAIYENEMVFSVDDGKVVVNRETLGSLFESPAVLAAVEASNRSEEFRQSFQMFECLVSPDSKRECFEVSQLNKVRLSVLVKESMPKKGVDSAQRDGDY